MTMREHIHIARRFQRSIRIDTDFGNAKALEGFVCPQSSTQVLLTMARHVSETGQGAFTWTGPYGSGKSSLAIAFAALLNGDADLQKQAARVMGKKLTTTTWKALPTGNKGWRILPVVGRRAHPTDVIGEAVRETGLATRRPRGGWTESNLIQTIQKAAMEESPSYGGLIIFIDEMGKFLEAAVQDDIDIYIFQQLAEAASRSDGRLLVVGILHQAFEEYAYRLSREMRDEWAKIQGRFIDLAVNAASEEQIDLISHAIESDHKPVTPSNHSVMVATLLYRDRPTDIEQFASKLENCWPLHPVVACLLGPISRRRFGQNQRSIFGFLNSAEPHGFQDFLRCTDDYALYGPDRLWDYLRANLEPSILVSPDGHRWMLAVEALERCESIGGDAVHIRLLKTIAIVDLFKERSGLLPNFSLLRTCLPEISERRLRKTLGQLESWSLTLFKKFLGAYAIYAGSDFDIDEAVKAELVEVDTVDFVALKMLAGLHPILAKRHYHETGALRWFEISLGPLCDIMALAKHYQPDNGSVGQFLLAIPTEGEGEEQAKRLCRKAARYSAEGDIVVGLSKRSWTIITLARELIALENVRNARPELAGDAIARREIKERIVAIQGQLESELRKAFDSAQWFRKHRSPKIYRHSDLNSLASELADRRFNKSPRLHNELLNHQKPSSSAVSAQNALLRRMVLNEGESRLGIQGYPAEGGLFASILEMTGLYAQGADGWHFGLPPRGDPCRIRPIWDVATKYIRNNSNRTVSVSGIYDLWRRQPFGVKDGLMPILIIAFILSQRNNLGVYRGGVFRTCLDDIDVQCLAKDATTIQLRWIDLSELTNRLLSSMAEIVCTLDQDNILTCLEPIDVARGLIRVFEQLPPWTKRTMQLSTNTIRVRDLFKRARDPNQFLFDDIPAIADIDLNCASDDNLQRVIAELRSGLEELVQAYPSMLCRLRDVMLAELQVPDHTSQSWGELRNRAKNIQQLAGDFHAEAFAGRLSQFDGTEEAFEGIASLVANKPPRDWVDSDFDRALVNIAEMAQRFLRAETFARVRGRPTKRHAIAVVIGMEGQPVPLLEEFYVAENDRSTVDALIEHIVIALEKADTNRRNIILAALAELSTRYITAKSIKPKTNGEGRATA